MKKYQLSAIVLALTVLLLDTQYLGANSSIQFLKSRPASDWSVVALGAVNSLDGVDLSPLSSDPGLSPTDVERRIMAMAVAGQNPDALVTRLASFYNGTEIENPSVPNLLSDDIFGVLALISANTRRDIASALANFIKLKQNSDGGWSHFTSGQSNSDFTAMAVMSLIAAGENSNSDPINRAFQFLSLTNTGSGFSHFPGSGADAYSTSWVIPAYTAAGKPIPAGATDFLASLMQSDGAFSGSEVLTAHAVVAQSGKFYPIKNAVTQNNLEQNQISISIHGPSGLIHESRISNASNVLETITRSGLNHTIRSTVFGTYVESINGVFESGSNGWMYAVNNHKPATSAASYSLSANDQVVWFYGGPNDQAPHSSGSTPGSVQDSVHLSVNITNPIPYQSSSSTQNSENPMIIFGVDVENVDFGTLKPGDVSATQFLKIANSGNVSINVNTDLTNSDALYHQGLFIDGVRWDDFETDLERGASRQLGLTLQVPNNYQQTGNKTGTLIFWANPK